MSYDGIYVDGRSAQPHRVRAAFLDATLVIRAAETGRELAQWPVKSVRVIDEVYSDRPVRLSPGRRSDERLTVSDGGILDELRRHSPRAGWRDYRGASVGKRIMIWGGGVVATVAAFFIAMPLIAEPLASVVPLEWERTLGRAASTQIDTLLQNPRTCRGPAGQAALDRLVARLSAARESRYSFSVRVVDHKLVNAFAAPGGYVVIFRGLIDEASSPEELAGVVAHEMGHVIERHGTEGLIRAAGTSLFFSLLFGNIGGIEGTLASYAEDMIGLSHTRGAEREADRLGITMLNRTNISGDGFVAFFQRMSKKEGNMRVASYFTSHPSSKERAETARRLVSGKGPAMTPGEWRAIKEMCRR